MRSLESRGVYAVIMIAISVLYVVSGCAYFRTPTPWDGRLFVGDAKSASLLRAQEPSDVVKCADVRFDDFVCMSKSDFGAWIANYKAYKAQCPEVTQAGLAQ